MNTKFKKINHEEILRLYKETNNIKYISEKLNISGYLIEKVLLLNGIEKKSYKIDRLNHDDVIRYYKESGNLEKTAKYFQVSEPTIKKVITLNGIEIKTQFSINSINHDEVIKKYNEIGNTKRTAEHFGISVTSITKILHLQGIVIKKIKIKDDDIIKEYNNTKRIIDVSKKFKLSDSYISKVLRNHNIDIVYTNKSGINIGDIFGKLIIIDIENYVTIGGNKRLKYVCKCECGNIVKMRSSEITVDKRSDCGCEYRKKLNETREINRIKKELIENRKIERIKNRKIKLPPTPKKYIPGYKKDRLLILSVTGTGNQKILTVQCDCGVIKDIRGVKSFKAAKSCGCLQIERSTIHGNAPKNDKYKKNWYDRWRGMISRCYNIKNARYSDYGGRGIKVCDRWLEPEGVGCKNYIEDIHNILGIQPGENYSLDRKNNDGMYEISNLRWATISEQNKNRRKKS